MSSLGIILRVVSLGFCLFTTTRQALAFPEPETVKIGVIAPMTMGNAERGKEIVNTLSTYSEMLNARSKNFRIEFIVEDGKCGIGNSATTAAEKLIRVDKVKFLITGCSGETLQAGPLAERSRVLLVAVFSAHQDVKKIGEFVFRTCPDQERAAELFASELECANLKNVFLLSEENAFTQGMKTLLVAKAGARIGGKEDFPPETTDFRTLLLKAKASDPEAMYFNAASPGSLSNLMNQAKNLGFTLPIFGYLHPDDPAFFKAAGENAVGMRYLGVPEAERAPPEYSEFAKRYVEKFGEPQIEVIRRTTFDALKSLAAGLEIYGADSEKVRTFLLSFKAEGATGLIEYDENGDLRNLEYVMKVFGKSGQGKAESACSRRQ